MLRLRKRLSSVILTFRGSVRVDFIFLISTINKPVKFGLKVLLTRSHLATELGIGHGVPRLSPASMGRKSLLATGFSQMLLGTTWVFDSQRPWEVGRSALP